MQKYTIFWDCGFGENEKEIEAESIDDAEAQAYEAWLEDAQHNSIYGVVVDGKVVR